MIVLGADTHKRSHTVAAVASATGELLGEQTVRVGRRGFDALLRWARGLDGERVWALEDCRHVSGSLERFLIARGERVLRIPTHLSATARKSARQRGKSDPIDAIGVARVALQEGLESFPAAHLDGPELDLRLLVDHRERLVRQRVGLNNTLQWHLHDLWPELELPGSSLFYGRWGPRVARRLARACASASPATSYGASASSRKRSRHSRQRSPSSSKRSLRSCSPSPDSDPSRRPSSSARSPARSASPPQPSWLTPPGSRQSPPAPATPSDSDSTRAATARSTPHCTGSSSPAPAATPRTQDYIARRRSEGKTTREAIRCLKRYLARHVWRLLQPPHPVQETLSPSIS